MISKEIYESELLPILDRYGINSPLRIAHFLAQIDHESNSLKRLSENFNYSIDGLLSTFSRERISFEECQKYGRKQGRPANQATIANIVYGGKWGKKNLGNTKWGDGWTYKGRGPLQCTGYANYNSFSMHTGHNYVDVPSLLEEMQIGVRFACFFWQNHNLNSFADKDDILSITRKINGGTLGFSHRASLLKEYKKWVNK